MDHWHCQRCGAEQVTAPLSVARTKLAKSRHKLASHIFSNMTLFFIYFFDPLFRIFSPPPLVCVLVPNPFKSQTSRNENICCQNKNTKLEKKMGLFDTKTSSVLCLRQSYKPIPCFRKTNVKMKI